MSARLFAAMDDAVDAAREDRGYCAADDQFRFRRLLRERGAPCTPFEDFRSLYAAWRSRCPAARPAIDHGSDATPP